MCHFTKSVHYHKNRIFTFFYPRPPLNKVHRYVMHLPHIRAMSLLILGQKKCSCKIFKVFLTPKCQINPPPLASHTNNLRIKQFGTQICFLYTNNHHTCKTYQMPLYHMLYTHQKNQCHWHTHLSHIQTPSILALGEVRSPNLHDKASVTMFFLHCL
jgi:hypothetical protein